MSPIARQSLQGFGDLLHKVRHVTLEVLELFDSVTMDCCPDPIPPGLRPTLAPPGIC